MDVRNQKFEEKKHNNTYSFESKTIEKSEWKKKSNSHAPRTAARKNIDIAVSIEIDESPLSPPFHCENLAFLGELLFWAAEFNGNKPPNNTHEKEEKNA